MNSGINNIIAFHLNVFRVDKKWTHVLRFSTILKGKLIMFMSLNKIHSSKCINISDDDTEITLIIGYIDTVNQTSKKDHLTTYFIVDKI